MKTPTPSTAPIVPATPIPVVAYISSATSEPSPAPAAAGGRMSTGAHERSIENQLHRIKAYAAQRNMEIIEIFTDAGVSTRSVKHRENRKRMIATVEAGKAAFKCILAYDVSRWGRLEAYDEAGYYESVCTRAGIAVHYCAEPPKNADITVSDMFESMRKFMAEKHRRKRPSKRSKTPARVNSRTSPGAWSRA